MRNETKAKYKEGVEARENFAGTPLAIRRMDANSLVGDPHSRLLVVAILAVPVAVSTVTPLTLWYVPAGSTLLVIVVNPLVRWFAGFVNGIVVWILTHL
jgi:hypothetical protein